MFWGFLIGSEKRGVEDGMDLPSGGNVEMESCMGDDFVYFKGTSSFHLEFLGSVHVKVGSFEPDLIFYFLLCFTPLSFPWHHHHP